MDGAVTPAAGGGGPQQANKGGVTGTATITPVAYICGGFY
jgi:hypothetical protein